MPDAGRSPVILLPGVVLPAELAYGDLVAALGGAADARVKDLELYATPEPPRGYGLDVEAAGILRAAAAAGFESFHLVGYSAGGAAALYFTARHPARVRTLALLEPAWVGWQDLAPEEAAFWEASDRLLRSPADRLMPGFVRVQLAPGVEPPPPPPGPPPDWMAARPAGIEAIIRAFRESDMEADALRAFSHPVYYALGALSNPDAFEARARRLAGVFSDFTLEVFEQRHHFDPPHRAEPERLAASLLAVWARSAAQ